MYSVEDFLQSLHCIFSRNFNLEKDGKIFFTNTPIGDIFNHGGKNANVEFEWFEGENGKNG